MLAELSDLIIVDDDSLRHLPDRRANLDNLRVGVIQLGPVHRELLHLHNGIVQLDQIVLEGRILDIERRTHCCPVSL